MTEAKIGALLEKVAAGRVSAAQALDRLRNLPFDDLGFARLDNHRMIRRGVPEVVFGDGKSVAQIVAIGRRMRKSGVNLIVTRVAAEKAGAIRRRLREFDYLPDARLGLVIVEPAVISGHGAIAVLSAGTSDIPVAE